MWKRTQRIDEEILQFVIDFKLAHNGLAPSRTEIATALHTSNSTIHQRLQQMAAQGRVKLYGHMQRNIMIPDIEVRLKDK